MIVWARLWPPIFSASRVKSGEPIASYVRPVVDEITNYLRNDTRGTVVFVPREANFVAHTLSKQALNGEEYFFWLEEYPPCVERFVLDDIHG
ncbi:hypothetical protein Dsin_011093 [Dipteronia sinensis]|uniref:RNase H type-1 domain-containing protein n=1 Tax=Dipteronia sinensis TaxID=43782 RepID=A0AAE0ATR9_9ROSI|nr:hypothetical protein Dsin_011093 [Dipteronia sinensis]